MAIDYDAAIEAFEWDVPEDYDLPSVIESHAMESGDRVALKFLSATGGRNERTYADLHADARRFANGLAELGVEKGDRVLHLLPRHPDVFSIQIGALAAGAILVPCSSMLTTEDLTFRAEDCEASTIVCHDSLTEMVEPIVEDTPIERVIVLGGARRPPENRPESVVDRADTDPGNWHSYSELLADRDTEFDGPELDSEDYMTINYTSGTTGPPKPVAHRHRWMYCFEQVNGPYWWGIDEETDLDTELLWATTGTGWAKWFWSPVGVALTAGATQLIYSGEFEPERFLTLLEQEEVTKFCAVPTQYRMFAQRDLSEYDLSLTDALSAGEPLNREPLEAMQEAFDIAPRDGYGQTETVGLVLNYPGIDVKPGSMGRPAPGMGTTIVDDAGEEVEAGAIGEIAVPVECPGLFDGYYERPDLDAETFADDLYRTGDLARRDEEGYYFFEGRADDVIVSAGYRIGPFEVEDALVDHEAIAEAAAVASPHEERGQVVKAYVVLTEGQEGSAELTEEIQEHTKERTAPYKYPRRVEYVSELPKTSSGKIRRIELRERERERYDEN